MKNLSILICISFLFGCSTYTPMSELKAQALLSGDWSEVERRERIMERRSRRGEPSCPDGGVALCVGGYSKNQCRCVSGESANLILSGRNW